MNLKFLYLASTLLLCCGYSVQNTIAVEPFFLKLSEAAIEQTKHKVVYDGSYRQIKYPNGDVPDSIGVCTDVVIRAYRKLGIDLQKLVHEDMTVAFAEYNKRRHSDRIDANIDHRRTPNLETFFTRKGARLPITSNPLDYQTGDIVFWDIAQGHVGIVVNELVMGTSRHYMVHNICCGVEKEDYLFEAKIVGHYRWNGKQN